VQVIISRVAEESHGEVEDDASALLVESLLKSGMLATASLTTKLLSMPLQVKVAGYGYG